jgi:cAMP-dependent protein kinase regulator
MSDAPADAVAPIDQPTLLTVALLRLAPETDLRVAEIRPDRVVVKYHPGRRYLVATPAQWRLLQSFGAGRTVPDVLFEAISDRHSPALREFYELVLKAFRHGILQVDGQPLPPPVAAAEWRAKAGGKTARWLALIAMAAAAVTIVLRPVAMPDNALQLLVGWLLCCAAGSAGYLLGACVLRGADGEVYHPRFVWKTIAPHFHADLGDVLMCGLDAETNVSLVRIAPQFVFTAVAALHSPGVLLPLLCGVFFYLSPLWPSPTLALLRGLYHDPALATAYNFAFVQHRMLSVLARARQRFDDRKFLLMCAGYTLVWLLLVLLAGTALLNVNALELWRHYLAAGGLHFTALALLTTFAIMVACVLGLLGWVAFNHARGWLRERALRQLRPQPAELTAESVLALLGRTLLFRNLPADDLRAIVTALQPEEHAKDSYVVREGELGDRLFIVFDGRVEVMRELAVGRPEAVATLSSGDIFGEIALLRPGGRRTRSVRCAETSVLLSLDKADFDRLVLSRMSRDTIADTVQKTSFLQRIPLSRHWSPHAMASFAHRAAFQEFGEGALIIEDGADNQFFHLIHEGEFAVLKKKKEIARLGPGAFFGEISLLQNSVATADIVSRTPGRCLLLSKREFLEFITRDFLIGLQFEDISSQRLHAPIFPLKGRSIDMMRAD